MAIVIDQTFEALGDSSDETVQRSKSTAQKKLAKLAEFYEFNGHKPPILPLKKVTCFEALGKKNSDFERQIQDTLAKLKHTKPAEDRKEGESDSLLSRLLKNHKHDRWKQFESWGSLEGSSDDFSDHCAR